jgi:hypothetical protein
MSALPHQPDLVHLLAEMGRQFESLSRAKGEVDAAHVLEEMKRASERIKKLVQGTSSPDTLVSNSELMISSFYLDIDKVSSAILVEPLSHRDEAWGGTAYPHPVGFAMKDAELIKMRISALGLISEAQSDALAASGIEPAVTELLRSFVESTVDRRVLEHHVHRHLAPTPVPLWHEDPIRPLSAVELGQALGGLTDETVRNREREGSVFAILRPGRKRGREYPAFQSWPGIAGEPLATVLATLKPLSSTHCYGFFVSPTELLGGLTPIEALMGRLTTPRGLDEETLGFLKSEASERLDAVLSAAKDYVGMHAA